MKIRLSDHSDWDSKDVALRDFLNAHRKGPWTMGIVTLTDGRTAVCRNPQMPTMVHPEATEIRVFSTDEPPGWCPLDMIQSLEITA